MVGSVTDSQSSSILTDLSPQQTTLSESEDSFISQLTSALEGYLAQSGNNPNMEIDIKTTQSQDSGVSQFLVTVTNPNSSSTPATATGASVGPSATPSATPADAGASTDATTGNTAAAPTDELDAYWAAQPAAVQQLRDIPSLAARSDLATTLTNE